MNNLRIQRALYVSLAVTICFHASFADTFNFQGFGSNNDWTNSVNWHHIGFPDIFPMDDGATPTSGDTVTVNGSHSVQLDIDSPSIGFFAVANGATLETNGNRFTVGNVTENAITRISDLGSQLFVESGDAFRDFDTDILELVDGGELDLRAGIAQIDATLSVDGNSSIAGRGLITFNNDIGTLGVIATIDGTIRPSLGTLTMTADFGGKIDLDGTSGDAVLDVNSSGAVALVIDAPINDAFDGTIEIGSGDRLEITNGWTHRGVMSMTGGTLDGTTFTHAAGSINANSGTNTINAASSFTGGTISIASGATLNVSIDATISGTAATTDGFFRLTDAVLDNATIAGTGRFITNNTLNVLGNVAVNAAELNWDGELSGSPTVTTIQPGSSLTINSDVVETNATEGYDGTVNVLAGSSLAVNTLAPWALEGSINLHGATVTGSKIEVSAAAADPLAVIQALSGSNSIQTSVDLADGAFLIVSSGATLTTNGAGTSVRVEQGSNVATNGTLVFAGSGATTYDGDNTITGTGTLQQNMDAIVSGGTTTINTGVFDWDGTGFTKTTINSNGTLVINSTIESSGDNVFDGELVLNGALHFDHAPWVANQAQIISGGSNAQLNGQRLSIQGAQSTLHTNGTLTVGADLWLDDQVDVRLLSANSKFDFRGNLSLNGSMIDSDFSPATVVFNGDVDVLSGDAIVNVAAIDLDGDDGTVNTVTVHPDASLTLNSNVIQLGPNGFGGQLIVDRGELTVNTTSGWQMTNSAAFITASGSTTSVSGSRMIVGGGSLFTVSGTGTAEFLAESNFVGDAWVSIGNGSTLRIDAPADFISTTVAGPGRIQANDDVDIFSGAEIIVDTLEVLNGGNVSLIGGQLTLNTLDLAASAGIMSFTGGILSTDTAIGNLTITGSSILAPATNGETQPVGTTFVTGNFAQTAQSTLAIDIGGYGAGQYDTVIVNGTASIEGFMDIAFVNGFTASAGHTFTVLTAAGGLLDNGIQLSGASGFGYSVVGGTDLILTFESLVDSDFNDDGAVDCVDIDALVTEVANGGSDSQFDLTGDNDIDLADVNRWLADAGAINLMSGNPYMPGDANLDGTVDGQDFLVWSSNKFTSITGWCSADFNADGTVDGADFLTWNSHKFMSSGTPLSSVPAPGVNNPILLLLLTSLRIATRSRIRASSHPNPQLRANDGGASSRLSSNSGVLGVS